MNLDDAIKLIDKYAECPKCGCETVGNGTGTIEIDTTKEEGYFKRTCHCGWSVTVRESELNDKRRQN